jgi:hypothetical protein
MSDKPLKRLDSDPMAILVAPSESEAQRVLNSYGMDRVIDRIHVVTSFLDAGMASIAYAADTPWTHSEGETADFLAALKQMHSAFGAPKLQSSAFNAQNMEYAIDPKRFRGQP